MTMGSRKTRQRMNDMQIHELDIVSDPFEEFLYSGALPFIIILIIIIIAVMIAVVMIMKKNGKTDENDSSAKNKKDRM